MVYLQYEWQPLIDAGVSLVAEQHLGDSPLHVAARLDLVGIMQQLIGTGLAWVNAVNWKSSTPLHAAAAATQVEAVQELLNAGADTCG